MLTIKINSLNKFTEDEKAKIIRSLLSAEAPLSTYLFRMKVAYSTFRENRGMTSKAIYDLFMSGADGEGNVHDGVISVDLDAFSDGSNTIGSTKVGGYRTKLNRRLLKDFDDADIVDNVVHEVMHRLKFVHTSWFRSRNLQTVPYRYGYAARDAFREFYQNPENKSYLTDTFEKKLKFVFD